MLDKNVKYQILINISVKIIIFLIIQLITQCTSPITFLGSENVVMFLKEACYAHHTPTNTLNKINGRTSVC